MMKAGIVGYGFVGKATARNINTKASLSMLDPDIGYTDDISDCNIVFICINETDNSMKNLEKLVEELIEKNRKCFFVIRTTVTPGTTDRFIRKYKRDFLFMPEFLREWNAEYDSIYPDKIVIGTEKINLYTIMQDLFKDAISPEKMIRITPTEAELSKLALNSLALLKVVFAEELYSLADGLKADYHNIYEVFKLDRNINARHLLAGKDGYRGANGKCLPKDTSFLIHTGRENQNRISILETAEIINKFLLRMRVVNGI